MLADIFEAAPELTEIGAAVAQSANATGLFRRLGLLEEYAKSATTPTELIYRGWRDAERIVAHPVWPGLLVPQPIRRSVLGIHRADLQRILGSAFGSHGLHLGCRFVNLVDEPALSSSSSPTVVSSMPTSSWAPTACAPQ